MKKPSIFLFVLPFMLFVFGCKHQQGTTGSTGGNTEKKAIADPTAKPTCKDLIKDADRIKIAQTPKITVDTLILNGDCLTINLTEYIKNAEYEVLWSGSVMKSLPAKAYFRLEQTKGDKKSKKPIHSSITVDLSLIKPFSDVNIYLDDFKKTVHYRTEKAQK